MYGLVRMVLGISVFLVVFFLVRRTSILRKRMICAITATAVLLAVVLSIFIPFENLLFTFSSPESAYRYYHSDVRDIEMVVTGESCDLVIGNQNQKDVLMILPKDDKGWKLASAMDTKLIAHTVSNGTAISVYEFKNSDDYFVTVLSLPGDVHEISDSLGSMFAYRDGTVSGYYANIHGWCHDYTLTINDTVVSFYEVRYE